MLALSLLLSVLVGLSLGLLGGGGSILTTPILLYVLGMEPKSAIAMSLVVVGVTSAVSTVQHARAGNVNVRVGLLFGGAGMAGALAGGTVSGYLPGRSLVWLFVAMMVVTAAAMFRGRRAPAAGEPRPMWRFATDGAAVGALTGLVGAGGGFIVVPALAVLGGLPMTQAIGTSLLVITLNTFAGVMAHIRETPIDWVLAAQLSGAAAVGSLVGKALSSQVSPEGLRKLFAGFVVLMALFVVYRELALAS